MGNSKRKIDVLCVGLAVVNFPVLPVDESVFSRDLTRVEAITLLPGGDAANQAIILSRLGVTTALCCRRGNDSFGDILLKLLETFGNDLDLSCVTVDSQAATGVCAMLIRPDGHRHFCSHRGANRTLSVEHVDVAKIAEAKIFSYTGLCSMPQIDTQVGELLKIANEAGTITVVDTKVDRAGLDIPKIMTQMKYIDYFFPSYDEAKILSGEVMPEKMADVFLTAGAKNVGIKLGGDGCYFVGGGVRFSLPAMPVNVVDTTGAGDSFMAGFISGILRNFDPYECCQLGTAAGAVCVGEVGPCGAIKNLEQINGYIKKYNIQGE